MWPAVLFFVRVNQVLVRLWARVIGADPFGLVLVPLSGCMSDRESCPSGQAPQWLGGEGSEACERSCWTVCLVYRASDGWGNGRQDPVMCEESSRQDDLQGCFRAV